MASINKETHLESLVMEYWLVEQSLPLVFGITSLAGNVNE
jgi:hypothetical protein